MNHSLVNLTKKFRIIEDCPAKTPERIASTHQLTGRLSPQQTDTTGGLDALLSLLGEELRLHDDGLGGQMSAAQQLVVTLRVQERREARKRISND